MGYEKAKGSLSIVDGLLTYENRIVIPQEEQTEILKILHESHQGFDKCIENAKTSSLVAKPCNRSEEHDDDLFVLPRT